MTAHKFASSGAVRQDGTLPVVECRDCGRSVVWATSAKTGKKYRVNLSYSQVGSPYYVKADFHTCDPQHAAEYAAFVQQEELRDRAEGRVRKGFRVEVVAGRKFPKGTQGEVFWIADTEDRYGVIKAGVATDDGDKIFINISNLQVI
jgi:uncharacterized Zn finger protein